MKNRKFWQWKNQGAQESEPRTLELYGTIAEESWFDDDVTPQMFHDELFADSGDVVVWINSPGGDCIAASAASVIAMAGTRVLMAPTALMMIHNPMTIAYGNHQDMQKAIGMLDEVKESIINAYEIRTGLGRARLAHLMDSETWMNANKAIELGFADAALEDAKKAPGMEAHSFSTKGAQTSLLNKITDKYAHKAAQAPLEQTGSGFAELEKRLNLIRPQ